MDMRAWTLGLALSCALGAPGWAEDVTLDDGRVVSGEVSTDPATGEVSVTVVTAGMTAVQHFPASKVVGIVRGTNNDEAGIVQARTALGADGDADAFWALSVRAQGIGDTVLARQLAADTISRDRYHAPAHKYLGMVAQNGIWMKPAEAAIARGEVRFEGRFMTWGAREAVIAARERRQRQMEMEHQQRVAAEKAEAEAEAEDDQSVPGLLPGGTVYTTNSPAILIAPPLQSQVQMWPTNPAPPPPQQGGLQIHAAGATGNTSWSFRWNF